MVFCEDEGVEPVDVLGTGVPSQMFNQKRRNPALTMALGDRESDLSLVPFPLPIVPADTNELTGSYRDEGHASCVIENSELLNLVVSEAVLDAKESEIGALRRD